jgi:Iron-containing redox enzyme
VPTCEWPDTMTSLPLSTFEFSPATDVEVAALASAPPEVIFGRLLRDQESEATFLLARRILAAFLPPDAGTAPAGGDVAGAVAAARESLLPSVQALAGRSDPQVHTAVLRQRAPLALLAGCWLDTVSQPATQPAVVVNRLFSHYFIIKGEGDPQRSLAHLRRRTLEAHGIRLPDVDAADFLGQATAHPLTARHGSFYLALSRLPASFLPEVAGVHYAFHALGVDDLLTGEPPPLGGAELRAALEEYLNLAGDADRARMRTAADLVIRLEREHVALLETLAAWIAEKSLDARVAEIIRRHARYAGPQHRNVRLGDMPLAEAMKADDPEALMRRLRESRLLRPVAGTDSRFVRAMKFGGPMFGVFDEQEAATFRLWAAPGRSGSGAATDQPGRGPEGLRSADEHAAAWDSRIALAEPGDVVFAEPSAWTHRELLYRLVNIEHFASTLPLARQRVRDALRRAEVLFTHGARGRFTDASYFDYSPESFISRLEQIYWDKMGEFRALTELPGRDEVIFGQKMSALGNLIDGAWSHRTGNLGRFHRPSDGLLFAIYADEMGHGDLRKNHITVIHQVLRSLGLELPHIRDAKFLEQNELPDEFYGYTLDQLCLALFPDSFYNEIMGYNLGIELYGLGELRLHEMQRLRHHGFDDSYERLHLSIDNFSAGHSRQSANLIMAYLDNVKRHSEETAVLAEWRRIWRGYAYFAYFIEAKLVRSLDVDLVI